MITPAALLTKMLGPDRDTVIDALVEELPMHRYQSYQYGWPSPSHEIRCSCGTWDREQQPNFSRHLAEALGAKVRGL